MSDARSEAARSVRQRMLALAGLVCCLQGCVPNFPLVSGANLDEQKIAKIRPGKTTRSEVLESFGLPLSIAKKGETLTVSAERAWVGSRIRAPGFDPVDADAFYELFSANHKITDRHRVYYYYHAISTKWAAVVIFYVYKSAHTRKDRLWVLINEETGIAEDYAYRKD